MIWINPNKQRARLFNKWQYSILGNISPFPISLIREMYIKIKMRLFSSKLKKKGWELSVSKNVENRALPKLFLGYEYTDLLSFDRNLKVQ